MQNNKNTLPLNATGYFSTLAEANLNTLENIMSRKRDYGNLLLDLGLRRARGGKGRLGTPFVGDFNNATGALGEGFRSARNSAVDRGFSSRGAMRNIAFDPIRRTIFDKAEQARQDMIAENQADKRRRRQILAAAARDAAQYGYEQRQPRERR